MLAALLSAAGFGFSFVVPVAAGSASAVALAVLLAHYDVVRKAQQARREFSRAVCTYLDLVALQLSAAHGPVQALEQAAAVCDGWVFERIREALRIAQLQMHVAVGRAARARRGDRRPGARRRRGHHAVVRHRGRAGPRDACVRRADSLRDQIRTDNLARAEAITGRLDVPGALLVFILIGFVLYPFMTRI